MADGSAVRLDAGARDRNSALRISNGLSQTIDRRRHDVDFSVRLARIDGDASSPPFESSVVRVERSEFNKGQRVRMNSTGSPSESVLDRIVLHKRKEIEAAKSVTPRSRVEALAATQREARGFLKAIQAQDRISLIAEVKKASPSKGVIRADFHPVEIAREYEAAGATCLSVLTDEHFFQGHLDYLKEIVNAVSLPVLRKDFVLDPYQVFEARAAGADAVLLIAECLTDREMGELRELIEQLGMTALVEFYHPENCQRVVDCGATLIGVNNRNLHTFETDLGHTLRMKESLPEGVVLVGESGIRTREDVLTLEQGGVGAMLVGESLMAQPDIGRAVRELIGE